jgi:hypothetical protein
VVVKRKTLRLPGIKPRFSGPPHFGVLYKAKKKSSAYVEVCLSIRDLAAAPKPLETDSSESDMGDFHENVRQYRS